MPAKFQYKLCVQCWFTSNYYSTQDYYCLNCEKALKNICTCKKRQKCSLCYQIEFYKTDFQQWMCWNSKDRYPFIFTPCDVCLSKADTEVYEFCHLCEKGVKGQCFEADGHRTMCNDCRYCLQFLYYRRQIFSASFSSSSFSGIFHCEIHVKLGLQNKSIVCVRLRDHF